jgi:hypothetical protein
MESCTSSYRKPFLLDVVSIWLAHSLASRVLWIPAYQGLCLEDTFWALESAVVLQQQLHQLWACYPQGTLLACRNVLKHICRLEVGIPRSYLLLSLLFHKLVQDSTLLLSYSEIHQSYDKTSVLNRKFNKLPVLTWTCIPSFGFSSAN